MSTPTVDIDDSPDGAFVAVIPPGRTLRTSLWNAVKLGSIWGILIGVGFNLYVSLGLTDLESDGLGESYTFSEFLTDQTGMLLPMSLALFLLVGAGIAAYKLWRQLPLTGRRSVHIEDGTLEFAKTGFFGGGRLVYSGELEEVDLVQQTEIPRSSLAGEVEPERNHEVTLATDDDLYVIATGLDGEESARLAESLERAIHERRSSSERGG